MFHEQVNSAHHFGGFLGLALHKIRSKSTHQPNNEQEKEKHPRPCKRAVSMRDVLSVSSTSFENNQQELQSIDSKTETTVLVEPELLSKCCRGSSFLKSSPKKQPMSASVSSSRSSSIASDADTLDQTLLNIKIKLRDLCSERYDMEARVEELQNNLLDIQHSCNGKYRFKSFESFTALSAYDQPNTDFPDINCNNKMASKREPPRKHKEDCSSRIIKNVMLSKQPQPDSEKVITHRVSTGSIPSKLLLLTSQTSPPTSSFNSPKNSPLLRAAPKHRLKRSSMSAPKITVSPPVLGGLHTTSEIFESNHTWSDDPLKFATSKSRVLPINEIEGCIRSDYSEDVNKSDLLTRKTEQENFEQGTLV